MSDMALHLAGDTRNFFFLCCATRAGRLLHLNFGVCFKIGAGFVCAVCGFL